MNFRLSFWFRKRRKKRCVAGHGNKLENIPKKAKVLIFGNNNMISFEKPVEGFHGTIQIGAPDSPTNNARIMIGKHIQANGVVILLLEDGSEIIIGDDCLISADVAIWGSDSHAIFSQNEGSLLNKGRNIHIGNHVWIGLRATILKNVILPDNCIVGAGAIVSSSIHPESGDIIAGNPACVVKKGVSWSKARPNDFFLTK